MINTQYINLNMIPSGVMPVLYCSQYDIGRPLGMVVYNGSEAVDLDSYTCTIEATRTDGTAITAAVNTNDNIGVFTTSATMTNQADQYPAKLVLFDSNSRRVASLAFVLHVTPKTMDENAESIEEDRSLYQQYTGTVQSQLTDLKNHSAWYVTPEDFDANTDDEAIRLCLAKAASEGKTAILGGVYSTSMPVEVSTGGQIVYINQINYAGNNSALVIKSGNNTIIAKQITSNGNGIEVVTDGGAVLNNSITVESVDSAKYSIYLHTEEYGIAYNRIEFNWLRAASGYNGIMCVASGDITKEAAFIGENVFYGGRLLGGDWGIYAQTNRQNSEITALKLNDFCFEGSDNCIHFDGVAYSYINSPRYAETQEQAENGIVWELTGNSTENVLTGEHYILLDKLSYSNCTNTQYNANKVNCLIRNTALSPIAESAKIYDGKIILDPVVKKMVTVSTSEYVVASDYQYTYFYVTATVGTITLNTSYNPMGIHEIIVQMDNGHEAIVKDATGTVIFDGTGRYPGVYRLYCYDVSGDTRWRFEYTIPTLKTLLKSISFSGTTTSDGMIYINDIVSGWNRTNVIVGVKVNNISSGGVLCTLGGQHGDNMRITDKNGAVVANTAVSGTIYYFEY